MLSHLFKKLPGHHASLGKCMTIGALIGLVFISFFLYKSDPADPAWGKYWMIRPLIIVPLAGAGGGFFYYLADHFRIQGGWKKIITNIVCLIIYLIGIWIGIVIGLDGTMWD